VKYVLVEISFFGLVLSNHVVPMLNRVVEVLQFHESEAQIKLDISYHALILLHYSFLDLPLVVLQRCLSEGKVGQWVLEVLFVFALLSLFYFFFLVLSATFVILAGVCLHKLVVT